MVSGVAVGPKKATARFGNMSTTISLPTRSGWRAASIMPMVPPIEWPITAGDFRPLAWM